MLSRGPHIVPLVGTRNLERLAESLGALDLTLDAGDQAMIETAVPPDAVAGARYDVMGMALLDSEPRR